MGGKKGGREGGREESCKLPNIPGENEEQPIDDIPQYREWERAYESVGLNA